MYPDAPSDSAGQGGRFQTTRWSLILSSIRGESEDERAREALAQLCRIYWRPIFAFISRNGYSPTDAQDLTQDFFVTILKGKIFERADPARGRFRSFLLKSLQHFLSDARTRQRAQKRGGDISFVAWDEWMAEAPSHLTMPAAALEQWPAEKIFDLRWAATVAEQALRHLAEECESRGRRRVFDALSGALVADRGEVSYERLATELSVAVSDVKRVLHQLRRRYGDLLRAEIAHTVENKEDVDDELRYLIAALASGTS
jgi:RNA polymerase sigma-70 factor (ECF subfamily)